MDDLNGLADLMDVAADRLADAGRLVVTRSSVDVGRVMAERAIEAMAFAEGILRAVAAGGRTIGPPRDVMGEAAQALLDNYADWANVRDDAPTLLSAELAAIGRFLNELVISD